jgi:hypothetical protein
MFLPARRIASPPLGPRAVSHPHSHDAHAVQALFSAQPRPIPSCWPHTSGRRLPQTAPRLSLYSRKLRPRHASSSATSPFPLPRTPDSPTSSSLPLIKPLSRAARLAVARRDSTLLTSPEQPLEPPRIRTPSSPPRPRRPSRRLPSHDVRACRSSASPRPPREQRRAETERRRARASLALDVPARAATPGSSPRASTSLSQSRLASRHPSGHPIACPTCSPRVRAPGAAAWPLRAGACHAKRRRTHAPSRRQARRRPP